MKESELKIIRVYENKQRKNFGAIVEVDSVSFANVIERKQLLIGWSVCNVMVNKLKVELHTNHPAWSFECKIYKRKMDMIRLHISYKE